MKNKPDPRMLDIMHKNPANWRGIFYVNRKDARLVVPKIHPLMGWTFNFANPYAYMVIFGIIAIIIIANWLF